MDSNLCIKFSLAVPAGKEHFLNKANLIIEEVNKVIIGKEKVIRKVWMTILSGGHVLLEDVPGVGKTTMALAFSKALGLSYRRIQFTPDVMPSDVVGFYYYNKESGKFEYRQGAVMTNLLLADEINRTSSRTQSALLEVMEEGQVTVDGVTRNIPEPFFVIATQNPLGSAGTQMLRVADGSFYGSFIYGIPNNKGRNDSDESEKGE